MKKLLFLLAAALLTDAIAPAAAQPNAAKNRITPPRYGEGGIENFSIWADRAGNSLRNTAAAQADRNSTSDFRLRRCAIDKK